MAIPPYGGRLVNRIVPLDQFERAVKACGGKSIQIGNFDRIHLTNIATGAYSPLIGYMVEDDYISVVENYRLGCGLEWSVPITLAIEIEDRNALNKDEDVVLKDGVGTPLAVMLVKDIFEVSLGEDCQRIFGTDDPAHSGAAQFLGQSSIRVGG